MEFVQLFGVFEILKKSVKIMSKNGRLLATITSIYLIIFSLFFLLNMSTIKPIITDFVAKSMMLPSLDRKGFLFAQVLDNILKDIKTLLGFELVFILSFFIVSLFAQTAIILLAGVSYIDNKIIPNDLLVRMPQPSIRLFITSFHVTLLRMGFLYFGFMVIMVPTTLVSEHKIVSKLMFWVLVVLVVSLYLYLMVVWVMALVVSVLESCSGIEALGKAGRLVKGKKLEGFVLNLLLNLVAYVLFHGASKMMAVKGSELTQAIFGVILVSGVCLMAMFEFQGYTVLYFECKKSHGDKIDLQGSVEYHKIPSIPLVGDV